MKHILIPCLMVILMTACSAPKTTHKSLDALLLENKAYYGRILPRMADEDTRVDSVDATTSELRFSCTLVTVSKAELDVQTLEAGMQQHLKQEARRVDNLNQLLKQGSTLVYSYKDKDGVHVAEIKVRND